jgi:hypothetical protein
LLALAATSLLPRQAQAQRWLQTATVEAQVETDGIARALLDTLINAARYTEDFELRRSPQDPQTYTVDQLQDQLINEGGYALQSANTVFISYRFEARSSSYTEKITDMYFVYRSMTGEEEDVPILYVDGNNATVQNIIRSRGTNIEGNLAAIETFNDQLLFAKIANPRKDNGVNIVRIGGKEVRGDSRMFEVEKRKLFSKVVRLTY